MNSKLPNFQTVKGRITPKPMNKVSETHFEALDRSIWKSMGFLFRSQYTKSFSIDLHYNISAWQKFPNNDRPNLSTFSSRTNLDT